MSLADSPSPSIALDPQRAAQLFAQIVSLQKDKRAAESLPLCEELAAMGLETPGLLHMHGWAERACGNLVRARHLFERALKLNPREVGCIVAYGIVLHDIGLYDPATHVFKLARDIDPFNPDVWNNLGRTQLAIGDGVTAETTLKRGLSLDPTKVQAASDLAKINVLKRDYKTAMAYLDGITKLIGFSSEIFLARMDVYYLAGALEEMEKEIENAPFDKLEPAHIGSLRQFQVASLHAKGHYKEAMARLEEWQHLDAVSPYDWFELMGLLSFSLGRMDEAIATVEDVIRLNPEKPAAKTQLGFFNLLKGNLQRGFELYENRWLTPGFPSNRRAFDAPRWTGEPLDGGSLLVWAEQGIGDEIRCSSLFNDLKDYGGAVTIECARKLVPVFEKAFPWATVRKNGPNDCRDDPDYRHFSYQIPTESLTPILRPTIEAFDSLQKPWLPRDLKLEEKMRRRMGIKPGQTVVGLCWRSGNMEPKRQQYFLRAEDLLPLAKLPDTVFVNLQYSGSDDEVARLKARGFKIRHFDDINQRDDLSSAMALIGACDIVLGAGTSVIDIASGLGRPAVTFHRIPELNSLGQPGRYPWYPTMKLRKFPESGNADIIPELVAEWDDLMVWAQDIQKKYPPVP